MKNTLKKIASLVIFSGVFFISSQTFALTKVVWNSGISYTFTPTSGATTCVFISTSPQTLAVGQVFTPTVGQFGYGYSTSNGYTGSLSNSTYYVIEVTGGTLCSLDSKTVIDSEIFNAVGAGSALIPTYYAATRFIEPYYPASGTFSTTSPTTFSGSFYNDGSNLYLDTLKIELRDTNSGESSSLQAGSGAITGTGTFSASGIINLGDTYLWRPVLYSATGSTTEIDGSWYSLTASSSPNYTPLPATVGTSTPPDVYNLITFLNVPNLLATKVPFAYFFQIATGITEGIQSTSSNAIPSGAFVWTNLTGGTTTFDFFSTSTIGYYMSPTIMSAWRGFLLVALTIEFGYALYSRAKSKKLI